MYMPNCEDDLSSMVIEVACKKNNEVAIIVFAFIRCLKTREVILRIRGTRSKKKNTLLQVEPFLTMLYTQQLSIACYQVSFYANNVESAYFTQPVQCL